MSPTDDRHQSRAPGVSADSETIRQRLIPYPTASPSCRFVHAQGSGEVLAIPASDHLPPQWSISLDTTPTAPNLS